MKYRGLELDPFQEDAIRALEAGRSVLVSAPTGTGKTIIADFIVEEALKTGRDVIYTAPIKALSNQKFRDYTKLHGEEKVGLVTGDLVIRRDAPCLVMTTEILRNMLLAGETLENLLAVIVDEIHFLDDRERGTVWEEILIYLPQRVQIVGLSATIANLDEFAEWLGHVRGAPVTVLKEERRAVPLTYYFASTETGLRTPQDYHERMKRLRGRHDARWEPKGREKGRGRGQGRGPERPVARTRHTDVFGMMADADMLPYLYFVFSRKDTERYAFSLGRKIETLLDHDETARVEHRLGQAAADLGPALDRDLRILYGKGIAFHHAGLHVSLKGLVEQLYEERLIKVLYCTSTFALGINMPARAVAFDGIMKFDGRSVSPLTTRGFMQKAGRAGRRGMDEAGYVVVRLDPEEYDEFRPVLESYRKGAYEPVRSSFNLSWNSVVNLLDRHEEGHIRAIVEKSFLNWHLVRQSERQLARADELEQQAETPREAKEARRLRRRAARDDDRVWTEFQQKVRFLEGVGYVDPSGEFNAGAKVLRHLQIAEIFVTELVLSGMLETLDPATLFGVLCGIVNDLPRGVNRNFHLKRDDRALARDIGLVAVSPVVRQAEEMSQVPTVWCPDLVPLGRAWAEGRSLAELLLMVQSAVDISGDLITGFRRAKDLAGQLRDVYADIRERADMLSALIKRVSRDEVEVVG